MISYKRRCFHQYISHLLQRYNYETGKMFSLKLFIFLLILALIIEEADSAGRRRRRRWRRRRRRRRRAVPPPPRCTRRNCVTGWNAWTQCNCLGTRTRSTRIITQPLCGGTPCPAVRTETGTCTAM